MFIKISGSILLPADTKTVFNFIANLQNDKLWRKEINETRMCGNPQINIKAIESSYLSEKSPNHINNLFCSDFVANKRIIYQTEAESAFYLKSTRQVERISESESKFTYQIEFDKAMVKQATGINIPSVIISSIAKNDMKKYLKKLKTVIEKSNATNYIESKHIWYCLQP